MASNKNNSDQFMTLMIVPHGRGQQSWSIRLPNWGIKSLIASAILVLVVFLGALAYSIQVTVRLANYPTLLKERKVQQAKIAAFTEETKQLNESLDEMHEREKELRNLLGLNSNISAPVPAIPSNLQSQWNKDLRKLDGQIAPIVLDLDKQYYALNHQSDMQLKSIKRLEKDVFNYRKRFSNTPSIWPVIGGYIYSGFGMRRHPILKRYEYHTGVDIPTFVGAPVKATAAGVVRFAGWLGGYGLAVYIDHGYGYATLYGHNSKLLAKSGDRVSKGMVISKAGSTGLSTAPHVHYEVRYWNKPIRPNNFLTLDLLTARARLW